jgi:hypothetical protein
LHNQLDTQLPGASFLITCTVPEALRPLCRSHPRLASQSLCRGRAQALKRLAKDPPFLGTMLPGFTGILHTWGRQRPYHPHMHAIVPGGGLSQERDAWLPARAHFSVSVRALSPLYRALFTQEMHTAGQLEQIDPHGWTTPWNVHSQATPHGATSLQYLAPYVFKVAISHRRLVGLQDRIVTCTYRQPGSTHPRTTRLDVLEFMRRFLQHVLPAGFMKVRHFGFMNANGRITTDTIRQLITSHTGATLEQPRCTAPTPAQVTCPHCGAPLIVLSRGWPLPMAIFDTGEDHDLDTSLTLSMLLWKETGDRPSASAARDNALQGHFGQAANGAPSSVWGSQYYPQGAIQARSSRILLHAPPSL